MIRPPPQDLSRKVLDAVTAVHSRWPRIAPVAHDAIVRLAAMTADADVDPKRIEEMYLATACGRGDVAATAAFEATVFPSIDGALRHAGLEDKIPEVRQLLRVRLFVGDSPKIATYSGRASLSRWLRVISLREAIALDERDRTTAPLDDDQWAVAIEDPTQNPELAHLRITYRASFDAAVGRACDLLRPAERNVLRLYFFENLTIDEIGQLYHVHRATAARRVARAQAAFAAHVRRILRSELCVVGAELDSILRLIESRIDLSLRRMFGHHEVRA
jgi:RNA polymerase sigma-70 factor, ECF subfamily